ncbi:hypothetical protein MES4922_590018 [Mesorhizobium ventifaucium]|uniref:Uncharacterized protein n=1 Tax=Mesorhizobium ventifaucium TaxID=666020 RepID=A0ABM9EC85_9HYPH|nr:hypothetical protein MES4922_590018 [Mesorhizobium ventifaucium]
MAEFRDSEGNRSRCSRGVGTLNFDAQFERLERAGERPLPSRLKTLSRKLASRRAILTTPTCTAQQLGKCLTAAHTEC